MENRRKVLITGAAGYIAGRMLPEFRQRYELELPGVHTATEQFAFKSKFCYHICYHSGNE